ncbi:4Fe-4S dicluster domain-containing protein [Candidatus Bathyarchaeota archaeon]|nr:4Fe-4S dicluster domain-containing protein [Candidatus Bathyarchaeota archaeon]
MPLKTVKKDTAEKLTLEWVLHVKNYKLSLDRNRCVGCQICSLACPKEAIKVEKQPKSNGEKTRKPKVDIDLAKCNFCGICDILCPYGAVKVTLDNEHSLPIIEKKCFPKPLRDIQVNPDKFPADQNEIEEACPLHLIRVLAPVSERTESKATVEVEKEYCPCCRVCEIKLPLGAMQVRKFIYGKIAIHQEKCPDGCTDCLDVCPITGALFLQDKDKKVAVNDTFCVYCGACRVVCPVEGALELERTRIIHEPIRSGAWNKTLERLTSPVGIAKELKNKGSLKARESVKKRVGLKGG